MERTHCPQGHVWNSVTAYVTPTGSLVCRECKAASQDRARRNETWHDRAEGSKQCTSCKIVFPTTSFKRESRNSDGIGAVCKQCRASQDKAKRDADPAISRAQTVGAYGISLNQYEQMFQQQQGLCAVCSQPETVVMYGQVKALCVDHDHSCCPAKRSCGKCIRGLLCHFCNMAAGYVRDNPEVATALATYLIDFSSKKGQVS